jgi:transcription-repair coupling factor (superfamily II helicase)
VNRLQEFAIEQVARARELEEGAEAALDGNNVIVYRLPGSAFSAFLAALYRRTQRPVCVLTSHTDRAEQVFDDLDFFGIDDVFLFAEDESLPYESDEPAIHILARQMEMQSRLLAGSSSTPGVFLVPLEAAMRKVLSPRLFQAHTLRIRVNDLLDIERTARALSDAGYIRVPIVETHGECAIRGGIIDIFPLTGEMPVRLDLFGNQVESIRYFDAATQRSLKKSPGDAVVLPPAKKNALIHESVANGHALVSILSLLPPETVLILDEPERFPARAKEFHDLVRRQHAEQTKHGETVAPPAALYETLDEVEHEIRERRPVIEHHLVELHDASANGRVRLAFRAGTYDALQPKLDTFLGIIHDGLERENLVVIACDNDGQILRFEEILNQRGIETISIPSTDPHARSFRPPVDHEPLGKVVLTTGPLHGGFLLPEAGLLFLTDREVFGRYKRRRVFKKVQQGTPIASAADIQRGDLVVHVDHGIGKFLGMRRQKLDGREADLIEIEYQDGDKLLVPTDKVHLVQRYAAAEAGAPPSLDKLGGKRWIARKKKSQEAIEKLATELLDLYAKRSTVRGHSYGSDSVWQTEFESSFLYQETPDQFQAIEDVKADLQRAVPMDRLVCGDVGYGKTEVAMRAAFKAVQEKKQVAVLVPTTILAQQHFQTFSERFADYDVRIGMLSRFKSPKEQRAVLRKARLGEIDILIGTHRLLSKDVEFADLGLLVVDEEHRFGVAHKERIKQLRTAVHVLTLTATPIPRTLHMALSGLRDMSVINTPPADRIPIKTDVIHFEKDLVEEAVLRELNRGGQIFFVHNRVHNINMIARRLAEIVPQAKIGIAHGQMDEHSLERVMTEFVEGRYDVLVSTTIIESGLDIPNVNTIVINRADALGLAQLYQLRGRVGRSNRQAYAYLVIPHGQPITDTAVRRLAAIQEFVELGAGFQIAMRDMEIRGTGNLLGREQHGAMIAIGFELYCDLLQKAVQKLRGEDYEAEIAAEVKWRVDAYIPEAYVPLEPQRLGLYKRLAQVRTLRAVRDIEDEMRDRYGRLPAPAEALVELAALRVAAGMASVGRVSELPGGMKLEPATGGQVLVHGLERVRHNAQSIQSIQAQFDDSIHVTMKPPGDGPIAKLQEAVSILQQVIELPK